jgi:CRISPR-associated endonuclease/helicase Cas3
MRIPFKDFFEAVWQRQPYPWQVELSKRVHEDRWPSSLDLPTGTGKTCVLDVALHHFVSDGGRTAPRRIFMVVDRRIIVDQVGLHARTILEAIDGSHEQGSKRRDVLRPFRTALQSIVGAGAPLLHTDLLRGGTIRTDAWAKYPHTPVLAGSTVDQVGSRLFFRGYGVSDRMRALHAGLLGCDTLIFLDEVHLARPFADVLEQLIRLRRRRGTADLGRPFEVVQLSATPGSSNLEADSGPGSEHPPQGSRESFRVLRLTEHDRRNERLAQILGAKKPATLEEVPVRGKNEAVKRHALAVSAVRNALEMIAEGRGAVAIVVNRVDTARRAWALLEEHRSTFDTDLLTGRMRPLDQQEVIRRISSRVLAGRVRSGDARPFVLVTTQCVEAGADYDFDGLVTEAASLDALRQRFGRLDRRGEYAQYTARAQHDGANAASHTARGVIIVRSDQARAGGDPVYGDSVCRTWQWLETVMRDGVVDFGIDALQPHLDALDTGMDDLLPPSIEVPVLLPAYLDQWAQTRPAPHADPDVALFLHGVPRDGRAALADVQVVWRSDITETDLRAEGSTLQALIDRIAMVPPGSLEALSLPVHAVKQWLSATSRTEEDDDIADVEGAMSGQETAATTSRRVLVWRGRSRSEVLFANAIAPGCTILVPESYGGIGVHGTFDPTAAVPPDVREERALQYDLGDAVQLLQRGSPTLRLDPRVIGRIVGTSFTATLPGLEDDIDYRDAMNDVLAAVREAAPDAPSWFQAILANLERPRFERLDDEYWIALGRRVRSGFDASIDPLGGEGEEDESFIGVPHPDLLDTHLSQVSAIAADYAARVRLPDRIVASLKWAGRLHDVGKVDSRFQVLLHGGDEIAARFGNQLAKSSLPWQSVAARRAARERAGYPEGQRHELVGLAMIQGSEALRKRMEADGADWDLVLHLVASHHGWCRPLPPVVKLAPDAAESVSFDCDGIRLSGSTDHGFSRMGSGIAERFWRLVRAYGWHELAYLEAILQLADHRQSAGEAIAPHTLAMSAEEVLP